MTSYEIKEELENIVSRNELQQDDNFIRVVFVKRDFLKDVLYYINELETDNERLNKKVEELSEVLSDSIKIKVKEIKSEAIKEFAERLKGKALTKYDYTDCIDIDEIDNLIKEMVGKS